MTFVISFLRERIDLLKALFIQNQKSFKLLSEWEKLLQSFLKISPSCSSQIEFVRLVKHLNIIYNNIKQEFNEENRK